MNPSTVDVRDLIERFRREATKLYTRDWPTIAVPAASEGFAIESEHLQYANDHWQLRASEDAPTSTLGSLVRRVLRPLAMRLVWFAARPYLDEEMRFRASVVNILNELAARVDAANETHRRIADAADRLIETSRATCTDLAERDELMHSLLEQRVRSLEDALAATRSPAMQ